MKLFLTEPLVRPQEALAPFEKETLGYWQGCASLRGEELSGSLLGTWAQLANDSSRSRLYPTWPRNIASLPHLRHHWLRLDGKDGSGNGTLSRLSPTHSRSVFPK